MSDDGLLLVPGFVAGAMFLTIYLCAGLAFAMVACLIGEVRTKAGKMAVSELVTLLVVLLVAFVVLVIIWPILLGIALFGKDRP